MIQPPRKLLLKNSQSPGDIVMLTAAVRDLHISWPGRFITHVKTTAMQLWENNPHVIPEEPPEGEAEVIDCLYPLIHRSNQGPWHFIHGFHQHLAEVLGVQVTPTLFCGDIHLSNQEKSWISQVQEITKIPVPFWIVAAGGKYDFTAKWWPSGRYQEVVDHFAGRILFVQVGEKSHHHPALKGVLDLRGKTDVRQLVRLMHHAQGVVCPVTFPMHLAAAVPCRHGMPGTRPCVVIAGGREPPQWEAYASHQFIHTSGALACCKTGGCWKSRVLPLGDGEPNDHPERLCVDVVHLQSKPLSFRRHSRDPVPEYASSSNSERVISDFLPRCLDMIVPADVIRRIQMYFEGGECRYLNHAERQAVREHILPPEPAPPASLSHA